ASVYAGPLAFSTYAAASCSLVLNPAKISENPAVLWRNLWRVTMPPCRLQCVPSFAGAFGESTAGIALLTDAFGFVAGTFGFVAAAFLVATGDRMQESILSLRFVLLGGLVP